MRALGLLLVPFLAACELDTRPTMNPGVDCVLCHTAATGIPLPSAPDAPGVSAPHLPFVAAGTVFKAPDSDVSDGVPDVHFLIYNSLVPDAGVELVSNVVGNFYTAEALEPQVGLTVAMVFQGKTVPMTTHPSPALLYGTGTPILGVGCNGCHGIPAAPTLPPDAGPAPTCPLPDSGAPDLTLGKPCGADLGCCSTLCVAGLCSNSPGVVGSTCTSTNDCYPVFCVDGACTSTRGENRHSCTTGSDCRLGYCEGGVCTGAPGRITIPSGLATFPDGGLGYGNP